MEMSKVNLIAIFMLIPILTITLLPFILIWGYDTFETGKDAFVDLILLYIIGGAVVHELLHGLTWACFTEKGMKSIKFGVAWRILTPYCHCKEPLKVKHYKLGGAMPLIVMGIIPSVLGIILGHGELLCFGIFFTWGAGGDILALNMLRKIDDEVYVSDHPDKMGFIRKIE